MTQLEEELGTQLLQRSVKGVTPTDAGQALYRHAQQILKLAGDTKNVVKASGRGPEADACGSGCRRASRWCWSRPLIAALEERHPQIVLEVYESPSTPSSRRT